MEGWILLVVWYGQGETFDVNMTATRKIIHVDMDAFFASIEQRDNPAIRGKPVAVGGTSNRGVVAAASYEARKFGVRSAMPTVMARKKCPELIFMPPRMNEYKLASQIIRSIFLSYTDLVEPLSLDEAYLDMTGCQLHQGSATLAAKAIQQRINEETGLTASAGVSFNKFLAKVSSGYQKPNGLTVIRPEEATPFIEQLSIDKFFGVGPKTAEKMRAMGINTGMDLKGRTKEELVNAFGKAGSYYYGIARGIDNRPVEPNRIRKSIGAECTFERDIKTLDEMKVRLEVIADNLWRRIRKAGMFGKTLTLKVKFGDFRQITRSHTHRENIDCFKKIWSSAKRLLEQSGVNGQRVRLLGLSVSSLGENGDHNGWIQLELDYGGWEEQRFDLTVHI